MDLEIKFQYPKTYEECCDRIGFNASLSLFYGSYDFTPIEITEYSGALEKKLNKLLQLLICSGAYWKIAGEEMGLGKPWEPDLEGDQVQYYIFNYNNQVDTNSGDTENHILSFPTKEMRDVFYENFKDLIEECKEFL